MGLINNTRIIGALFLIGLLVVPGNGILYAQNTITPAQFGAEIQKLEQILSSASPPPSARHDALVRLAQLRQLSGNIAGAAFHWLDAAAADPNDAAALVSGAFCLAAIGEWERAALSIQPLLSSGKSGPAVMQARYLDACLRALSTHDVSTLTNLAGTPEFAALRPMIYYSLWQIAARNPEITGTSGADTWKTRLLAEFPQSPEARSANPAASAAISAVQGPLWLLFPGGVAGSAIPVIPVRPAEAPIPAAPMPVAPMPVAPPPVVPASVGILQTGLFSKEANARSQSDALYRAGFPSAITRKLVNGAEYWAVTVPAGQNENKTIADLKKAGFDSFPVK